MAYPVVDAPYGLKPVNLIGGQVFAGSTREVPIQYGSSVSIYYGDFVRVIRGNAMRLGITTDGTAQGMVGIFLGCSYTNPQTKQKQFAQYWPGGTLAGDAVAIICDDPDTVFKAVVCSSGSTVASGSYAMIGQNYGVLDNTGSANTGNSAVALAYSATLTTAAFPCRVVGVVPETAVVVSAVASTSGSSTTLTLAAANSAILAGMQVVAAGTGAAQGNYITVTNVNGATLTVSSAITVASGTTCSFIGFPEVLVTWNGSFHSMNNTTGV
jgi:hypothetical protein